jgi:hypothetical protein
MEINLRKTGMICFWIALIIELIVVIIDKSAYTNPYEGWIFRITFLMFCVKAATTRYNVREIFIIGICGIVAVLSYFVNGRDETVRAFIFVVACKDVDIRRMLKTTLAVTAVGAVVLFILSATGIFGVFARTADYGRGGIETRYCFGMGHPNAFQVMLLMMTSLVLYLYSEKMKIYHFVLIIAVNVVSYLFTDSNTGILVTVAMVVAIMALKYIKALQNMKSIYVFGLIIFVSAVAFSVYGAYVGNTTPFMYTLDKALNGRFQYAYYIENARLENWKPFAIAGNEEFFDQGFIRLVYWYGIIPGIMYVAANIYLIWQSYKNKDYCLLVIVVAYSVLTVMEAHLISVYILRNYLLIWLGYYWYRGFLINKGINERQDMIHEALGQKKCWVKVLLSK